MRPWASCARARSSSMCAEALPEASVLKLGCTWPLPAVKLRDFAASVERLYVIEEASTYLADGVRACGVEVVRDFVSPSWRRRVHPGTHSRGLRLVRARPRSASRRPAGPPPCALRRMPASPGVQGALSHEGHRHRGYRLLHPGRAAAAFRHGHLRGHGRLRLHGPRRGAGPCGHGAQARGGGHRRLHLRPFGALLARYPPSTTRAAPRCASWTIEPRP